jgi:galactose mutarotase-like enzyme
MKNPSIAFLIFFLFSGALLADEPTVTIQGDHLTVVLETEGAQLKSIQHTSTGTEYLWQGDPEYWAERAPNMFPVCVRFKDHQFTYQNQPYEMPFLGLAVTNHFDTTQHRSDFVRQTMVSSSATRVHYPFPFQLDIESEVNGLTLTQRYVITNHGTTPMYYALGGHPGFNTPLTHGRTRNDYEIVFSERMTTHRTEIADGLQQSHRIPFLKNEDRLRLGDERVPPSGMFLREPPSRQIGIARTGKNPYVVVDLGDFPNTNLWTPPGMPYACIEPMVGHHDLQETLESIEAKPFLIKHPAGETRTYAYTITIVPEEGTPALSP